MAGEIGKGNKEKSGARVGRGLRALVSRSALIFTVIAHALHVNRCRNLRALREHKPGRPSIMGSEVYWFSWAPAITSVEIEEAVVGSSPFSAKKKKIIIIIKNQRALRANL